MSVQARATRLGKMTGAARRVLPVDDIVVRLENMKYQGLSDPQHLREVLARPDVDADLNRQIRTALTSAIVDRLIEPPSLQARLSAMRSAHNASQVRQELAELRAANLAVAERLVARGTKVHVSVERKSGPFDLGDGDPVSIAPVDEADLLFRGDDGRVHLYETKHRASALQAKARKQLPKLSLWRNADPTRREVRVVVDSEDGWTEMFGRFDVMKDLMRRQITLHIAGATWDPKRMNEIWNAVAQHAKETKNWPPGAAFFARIDTFDKAEAALGISLR